MSAALDSPWRRLRFTRMRDLLRGRVDGSLDWRRVIETSGLPVELTSIVHQLVRRTRLWDNERVAVATEFVSHFREGLEAGQTPAELAASFGDVNAAAKLIRRAKKRGRSLWWHAWRWTFWGVAALFAAYAFLWARMWWGRPVVRVDYIEQINQHAATVELDEAAWPLYEQAMGELGYKNGVGFRGGVDWKNLPKDAATDSDFAEFEEAHRGTIAKLRQATRRVGFGPAVLSKGNPQSELVVTRIRLPAINLIQTSVQVLMSQARRAAAEGDLETAVADAIAVINMGRQLQDQPFITSGLLAMACTKAGYEFIEELVRDYGADVTDEQLRDLAHSVASVPLDSDWWIESERFFSRDLMQHLFTENGSGDGHMTAHGLELLRRVVEPMVMVSPNSVQPHDVTFDSKLLVAPVAMASRREMTELFERFFDEMRTRSDQPLWEWEAPDDEDFFADWSGREQLRYYPLSLVLPASAVWRRQLEWNRGSRDGVLVGLALELHHREHGAWPETLAELSPQYLPRVPVDRMTGKPLGYVVRDDQPLVYSVGADLDDDGGHAVTGKDAEWRASPGGYWGSRKFDSDIDGDWVLWGGEEFEEEK
jgi:hypothetical protein